MSAHAHSLLWAEAASSKFTKTTKESTFHPFHPSSSFLVHYESLRFLFTVKYLEKWRKPRTHLCHSNFNFVFFFPRTNLISSFLERNSKTRNNWIERCTRIRDCKPRISARLLLNWRLSNTAGSLVIFSFPAVLKSCVNARLERESETNLCAWTQRGDDNNTRIMGFPVESISSSEDIREMARFYEANRVEVKPDLSDNWCLITRVCHSLSDALTNSH